MAAPPWLPDDLVEDILLRLPPDDPACILRASLVCTTWSSIISRPGFRRRFHEHHRAPPVLGFLHDWDDERIPRFIPTTASSFSLAAPDRRSWRAIDCRHGRALFLSKGQGSRELLLWEPVTGAQQRVPVPAAAEKSEHPTAAVLCAADGCDHRDCLGGPFRVVFVFYLVLDNVDYWDHWYVTYACVYSSETGTWGEPTSPVRQIANFTEYSSTLVGSSLLYFLSDGESILEYDLASHSLTEFNPPDDSFEQKFRLMLAENGELLVSESLNPPYGGLYLWSMQLSGGTRASWVLSREIYYQNMLPNDAIVNYVHVVGFAEGANAIFVRTDVGLFMIELQSEQARKVCNVRVRPCGNLFPVVGFYTPHSRLKALGGKHHNLPLLRNPTKEETLKFAHELFDKGCKAMQGKNFASASDCFRRALKIRVLHYGKLAPKCASTFYRYGYALLCKALSATNPSSSVSKSAPNKESVIITATASKDDAGSSSTSGSNVEHVLPSHRGENLNNKDQEDVNMAGNKANSDLHLAWKMLDIARAIVVKSPEKMMEKANIFYALAEVSMKREDRDSAIVYYMEALAILEHLVRPDDLRVAQLNFRICLVFELASRVGDAIPYCAKAISLCQSHIQNLKNAKEGLLADKDIGASAAEGHSGKFTQEDNISSLTRLLARLQKKLEELDQAVSKQSTGKNWSNVSQTSREQNVSNTVARAASLDSQVPGSNDSIHFQTMPTEATTGSVSRGIKRANDELISAEPSLKRLASDD
ncbi:unnamed protein product [Alopecurus aequalis]